MMFEVEISEQADNDLREIYQYIVFELRSPENARRQLARLEKSIMSLEKMPERFRLYEKEPWHSRGLRLFPVDNYMVLYIAQKKTKIVGSKKPYGIRDGAMIQQIKGLLHNCEDLSLNPQHPLKNWV